MLGLLRKKYVFFLPATCALAKIAAPTVYIYNPIDIHYTVHIVLYIVYIYGIRSGIPICPPRTPPTLSPLPVIRIFKHCFVDALKVPGLQAL